tara:strand:+ start:189 stop:407 length:219 start_codon:yes stop_codon:yes gene_type:complete
MNHSLLRTGSEDRLDISLGGRLFASELRLLVGSDDGRKGLAETLKQKHEAYGRSDDVAWRYVWHWDGIKHAS